MTARGAFPDSDPHHLGMPGMHGSVPAVTSMQKADLIVALGARFDDRVTGHVESFAPHAKVVHVDVDPAEISKIRLADVPIVGDLKAVIPELIDAVSELQRENGPADLGGWWAILNRIKDEYPLGYVPTEDGLGSPQHVI